MAIYKNIGSATTTPLITKGRGKGAISKITIANHHDSLSNTINLYLYDDTPSAEQTYVITETTIPPRATLALDDNLSYNSSVYHLKITTSSAATTTIIIK